MSFKGRREHENCAEWEASYCLGDRELSDEEFIKLCSEFVTRKDEPRLLSGGGYPSVWDIVGDILVVASTAMGTDEPLLDCYEVDRVKEFVSHCEELGGMDEAFEHVFYEEDFFGE
jgi:tRNA G37 N-methylase Trm5